MLLTNKKFNLFWSNQNWIKNFLLMRITDRTRHNYKIVININYKIVKYNYNSYKSAQKLWSK